MPPKVRVEGDDRYAMAVAASRAAFPGRARAPVVLPRLRGVAVGGVRGGPGGGRAGRRGAADPSRRHPRVTATELDRLDPDRIVLVGGSKVLGPAVARAAAGHAPAVDRVDGGGPVATSSELARVAFPAATRAWVVAADRPEHAVVAATAAAANRSPVLVVDGSAAGCRRGRRTCSGSSVSRP